MIAFFMASPKVETLGHKKTIKLMVLKFLESRF